MSDPSENPVTQPDNDKCTPEIDIDTTNYFKEQDEKFEELHKKLQTLKEENKRQIDAVINSLDDLMANKCVIERFVPDPCPIRLDVPKMSVAKILSRITEIDMSLKECPHGVKEDEKCQHQDCLELFKEDPEDETAKEISELLKKIEDDILERRVDSEESQRRLEKSRECQRQLDEINSLLAIDESINVITGLPRDNSDG